MKLQKTDDNSILIRNVKAQTWNDSCQFWQRYTNTTYDNLRLNASGTSLFSSRFNNYSYYD